VRYRGSFGPLDALLKADTSTSYYDATACHLDLSQWATAPAWSGIPDKAIRRQLFDEGVQHLRAQLARENVRIILLNGRQVLIQVQAVELTEIGQLDDRGRRCRLYSGASASLRWLGWSTNPQSSWGVSSDFKHRLG
jgi:hypothetical protein